MCDADILAMDQQRSVPSSGSSTSSSTASSSALSSPLLHPSQHRRSPIGPPPPLAIPSSGRTNTAYSLFESQATTAHPPWDWLPSQVLRKHSVALDGSDYHSNHHLFPKTSSDAGIWRRASAPNAAAQTSTCAVCQGHCNSLPQSCGQHLICQTCLATQFPLIIRKTPRCPLCQTVVANTSASLTEEQTPCYFGYQALPSQLPPTLLCTAHPTLRNIITTPPPHFPCVKLTNIPWDVSQSDIRNLFDNCRFPSISVYPQAIHIMMDRTTGKTLSDAYVEFATHSDLRRAIETRNQKPLKGRIVSASECSQEELLSVIFSKWRGQFRGISAIPPASDVVKTMSTAVGGGGTSCPPFITREEINSLLVVCKNYKLHFSRKCAERPFENIISVITKYPWHQAHLITTMHRDHIYEMLKLSVESLKVHLSKDYVHIEPTLLERLMRTGIMCPAFTERQKMTLLQTTRLECPPDISYHMLPVGASGHFNTGLQTPLPNPHLSGIQYDRKPQQPESFQQQLFQYSQQQFEEHFSRSKHAMREGPLLQDPKNPVHASVWTSDHRPSLENTKQGPVVDKTQVEMWVGMLPALSPMNIGSDNDNDKKTPGATRHLSPWAPPYSPTSHIWMSSSDSSKSNNKSIQIA